MTQTKPITLLKWPFFIGNAAMLAAAGLIYLQPRKAPMNQWETALFLSCALLGALLAILPFVLEYRAALRLSEAGALISTVAKIRNLELLAAQINAATARWQMVQEHSVNSVNAAKEITQKVAVEAAAFADFLEKSNDTERANLRLEVEKLRRMENEWLQVIVRLLDHTYALYKAAERSGQPGLIDQLGRFQNSSRDVARRIGLLPLIPGPNEPFDPQWHQPADEQMQVVAGARIVDTVATGYTYQGRLLRPALVALKTSETDELTNGSDLPAETTPDEAGDELEEKSLL
jgi:molecular chaperone GrpE (heat shock protein)